MFRAFALPAAILIVATAAYPATGRDLTTLPSGDKIEMVRGRCVDTSHVAEGPLGADLTKRQARFFCDSAMILYVKRDPGRVLIQFTERRSTTTTPIGFAGFLDKDGILMDVRRLYLRVGMPPSTVNAGGCQFSFKNKHMEEITCLGVVDREDRRTVANIIFDADPGQ